MKKRAGMVEHCLFLQLGVLSTGERVHVRVHVCEHTHALSHGFVRVRLHVHAPDCSAETALFLQSRHRRRHFVAELRRSPKWWRRKKGRGGVIMARSKHACHMQLAKHEAFHLFFSLVSEKKRRGVTCAPVHLPSFLVWELYYSFLTKKHFF